MPLNQAGPKPTIWWGKNVAAQDQAAATFTKGAQQARNLYKMLETSCGKAFSYSGLMLTSKRSPNPHKPHGKDSCRFFSSPSDAVAQTVFANGGKSSRNCQECCDMSGHSCTT